MLSKILFTCSILFLLTANGFGQATLPPGDLHTNAAADSERIKRENARQSSETLPAAFDSMMEVRPDEKLKYSRKSEVYFLGNEMSRLLPSAEYTDKYAEWKELSQKNAPTLK